MHRSRFVAERCRAGFNKTGGFKTGGFQNLQQLAGLLAAQTIRHSRPTMLQCAADHRGQRFRRDDGQHTMPTNGSAQNFLKTLTRIRECLTFGRTNRRRILFSRSKKLRETATDFGFRQSLPESKQT